MRNDWNQALRKAAARTFEDLSMLLPNPDLSDRQREADLQGAVGISFEGALRGWLILRICGDVLPELTASMLGEDRTPSVDEQRDAMGEVANVICGNLLPDLAGVRAICHIAAPLGIDVANPKPLHAMPPPTAAVTIGLNEGRAEVMLYVDRNAGAGEETLS